jgi:TetR/AcrR family transcriptional regulator, transcriptional repressor for nem operon
MRYGENHKNETHEKLVRAACVVLREKGPDRLSVAEVMQAAGLTHGGFYAHFKSKDALLVEALNSAFAHAGSRFRKVVDGMPAKHALATYVDMYVSPVHRDNVSGGCPIVALNSDAPRQSKKFQKAFQGGIDHIVNALAGWIGETGRDDAQTLARAAFSAMAGAVALSRAVSDKTLSDELLASARDGIKARLGVSDVELSKAVN